VPDSRPPSVAPPGSLRGRDLISAADLTPAEVRRVFATATDLKAEFVVGRCHSRPPLVRRTLAMLFERPSLRTRVTFEAGMIQLGGSAIQLTSGNVGWGVRESIADVARNLDGFVDAIVIRTGPHEVAVEFAAQAAIPVINALTLHEHPCQALADAILSTSQMVRYCGQSPASTFLIGTEEGLLYRLKKENPGKTFYVLSPGLLCPNMKRTRLDAVLRTMELKRNVITIPEDIRLRAKRALDRMLQVV